MVNCKLSEVGRGFREEEIVELHVKQSGKSFPEEEIGELHVK